MSACHHITLALALGLLASAARADHRIGDICRIKGQEENVLQGIGLVTGLKGTGDGDMKTTTRALSHYLEVLGHRVGTSATGQPMLEELKGAKNVALVFVTATVPAGGAQQGDSLDCVISAFGAKSLDGGQLMLTEMYGPIPGERTVYGLARGLVSLDDVSRPQIGRLPLGCQVERKVENKFIENGKLILVMHKDHAAFQTTADLEMAINREQDFTAGKSGQGVAKAIDQVRIEVTIPPTYTDNPPLFAARLLDTRYNPPPVDTRVIINERKQVIVIGAEVEIGAVAVMHKNRLIQIGNEQLNQAVAFDPKGDSTKPRLAALVDALNDLKVPTSDVIDIIKLLKHKRALFGELIIE
jgi:flagellar P-ring protein precursor FlgI